MENKLEELKKKRDKMFVQKVSEIGYKALHDKSWSDKDTENEFLKFIDQACSETAEAVAREEKIEILKKILLHYEKNRLDGKGFDFYFVLNDELDNLNSLKE